MILTDEEKRMRDGAEGVATAAAMNLLIRYGDALACDRLCDVRNVAGTMTQPSPVKQKLVEQGGWDKAFAVINLDCDDDIEVPAMRVPTCQLQHGFGADAKGIVPYPDRNIELQAEAEAFYGSRGVNILATCTPYQVGNIPVRGEHCAWMEFAGEDHPVITGDLGRPDLTDLKHLGAAAATSGGVELYHIPGLTPEAPTTQAAFGTPKLPEPAVYGLAQRQAVYDTLNAQGTSPDADFVLLGCPHASVDQVRRAAAALDGRRLGRGTELWLMLPRALKDVADRSG